MPLPQESTHFINRENPGKNQIIINEILTHFLTSKKLLPNAATCALEFPLELFHITRKYIYSWKKWGFLSSLLVFGKKKSYF